VFPPIGTGLISACLTKHPRSALRITFTARSGGSDDSSSSVCPYRASQKASAALKY